MSIEDQEDDPFLKPFWEDETDENEPPIQSTAHTSKDETINDILTRFGFGKTRFPERSETGVDSNQQSKPLHKDHGHQPALKSGKFEKTYFAKALKAQDALSRLDATFLSLPYKQKLGSLRRISLNEIHGLLLHHSYSVSRQSLALNLAGMTSSFSAENALKNNTLELEENSQIDPEMDIGTLPSYGEIEAAKGYISAWSALGNYQHGLDFKNADSFLVPLAKLGCHFKEPDLFRSWLSSSMTEYDKPGPLLPAWIVAYGLPEHQREEKIDLGSAYIAAAFWRMSRLNKAFPLPFFSAPTRMLNLLGRMGGEDFDKLYFDCLAEASLACLREIQRVKDNNEAIEALPVKTRNALSRLFAYAHEVPIFTSSQAARRLGLTERGMRNQIQSLVDAKILKEMTNKITWRAYSLM